ncbi:MAG: ATPase [Deltaproteobacteria bacterium]|nr:ATPase [Deltaproteobacteria bacterium]
MPERDHTGAVDGAEREAPPAWHSGRPDDVAAALGSSLAGLSDAEASERLGHFGPNRLDPPKPPSGWEIALRQFGSPLIYVLMAAAAIALALGELTDAGFIAAVLVLNAGIGFAQEYRAEQAVHALFQLIRTQARVRRGGRTIDIDGEAVVPGDLLLVESGARVSADVRLVSSQGLRVDESLLTGESVPVDKDEDRVLSPEVPLADRRNMLFAGSMVASGRGFGLVVATARATEVGSIAESLAQIRREPPPLLRRMERFARVIGAAAVALAVVLVGVGLLRGQSLADLLLGAIALAVSAVPEGLPIALTVALAVAVSRMTRRRVVVRRLPAVEALGSCGVIATDKTGTLTHNELTVERVVLPGLRCEVTGSGYEPHGEIQANGRPLLLEEQPDLYRLLRAGCLANEASLSCRADEDDGWEWSGDPTDVALLSLGLKGSLDPVPLRTIHDPVAALPFEPERRYAASYHRDGTTGGLVCVKGAPEEVLAMCASELDEAGVVHPLDLAAAEREVDGLMREGYRVLAVADRVGAEALARGQAPPAPRDLTFLGLLAMTDPPREAVPDAVAACRRAGIHVVMVTGDHATTAAAIAERIGLGSSSTPALTGATIDAIDEETLAERVGGCSVVARATPRDKLRVVRAFQARGELVAVTGDGVNDAPALRQADLGVAMGRSGTDVAREAAELILTDDDFSSIVGGVEEGRIAYDNVRKVTYLLVSTGAGEVLMVTAALVLGLPIPLTAVQLLWLNLVTNGIQDVALAFEAGEPGVLDRPPRPARERIFDRLMIERTLLAGGVFGGIGLAAWLFWMRQGVPVEEARNLMVQLFVLFEIFHIGNSRSERVSLFRMSPMRNPVLFMGTLGALGVHFAALYSPFTQRVLGLAPLDLGAWLSLATWAATIVVVMELHKAWRRWRPLAP